MAVAETVESLKKSSIYGIVRRRYSKYIIIVMGKVLDFCKIDNLDDYFKTIAAIHL